MAHPDHPAGSDLGPAAPADGPVTRPVADDEACATVAAAVLADTPPVDAPPALVAEIDSILAGIDSSRSLLSADEVRDWLLDLRGIAAN